MKFALVVSQFNEKISQGLQKGALAFLDEKKVPLQSIKVFYVPGAFEIPLVAQKLAKSTRFDGIICLGAVIKGETAHFEMISLGATTGLMQAILATEVPMSFGILTTYTEDQALVRSQENAENKGREAAQACFETVHLLREL